jgi:hypothetical protein
MSGWGATMGRVIKHEYRIGASWRRCGGWGTKALADCAERARAVNAPMTEALIFLTSWFHPSSSVDHDPSHETSRRPRRMLCCTPARLMSEVARRDLETLRPNIRMLSRPVELPSKGVE